MSPSGFFVDEGRCDLVVSPGLECYQCRFDKGRYHDGLFDQYGIERSATLAGAVAKRKAEFLAGRYAARRAMQRLGAEAMTVRIGEYRSPVWPPGLVGSISHTDGVAVCMVAHATRYASAGIDVEPWIAPAIANDVRTTIVKGAEEALLRQLPLAFEQGLTLAFSAKESLFKALYPRVRRFFDFGDVSLRQVDVRARELQLELATSLDDRLAEGAVFRLSFTTDPDKVFTAVLIPTCAQGEEEPP